MEYEDKWAGVVLILLVVAIAISLTIPEKHLSPGAWGTLCGLLIFSAVASAFWILSRGIKLRRTAFEPVWSPLDKSRIAPVFKRYIEVNTSAAEALGYVPVGVHLVEKTPLRRNEAACFLHPQGHSPLLISHYGKQRGVSIFSFLDDGSVIHSTNLPQPDKSFNSRMEVHGFFITHSPYFPIKILSESHDGLLQAVLSDQNIRLRKLSVRDWRQYALYAFRRFNQIAFDLGSYLNRPKPFTFPSGNLVSADYIKSAPAARTLHPQP